MGHAQAINDMPTNGDHRHDQDNLQAQVMLVGVRLEYINQFESQEHQ